jgi:hypothetical protein
LDPYIVIVQNVLCSGHEGARGAQADRRLWAAHRAARRPGRGGAAGRAALRDRVARQEGRRRGQV